MRQDPSQVEGVRLAVNRGPEGVALVPLGEVARYSLSDTPSEINRQALTREVVLSANSTGCRWGGDEQGQGDRRQGADASRVRVVFTGEGET